MWSLFLKIWHCLLIYNFEIMHISKIQSISRNPNINLNKKYLIYCMFAHSHIFLNTLYLPCNGCDLWIINKLLVIHYSSKCLRWYSYLWSTEMFNFITIPLSIYSSGKFLSTKHIILFLPHFCKVSYCCCVTELWILSLLFTCPITVFDKFQNIVNEKWHFHCLFR